MLFRSDHSLPPAVFLFLLAVSPSPLPASVDCNGNGIDDSVDISTGASDDCDSNGWPDECDPLVLFEKQDSSVGTPYSLLDLDGDALPDLVTADGIGVFRVQTNLGGGRFGAERDYRRNGRPLAAHLNGDAFPDLVACGFLCCGAPYLTVSVLSNDGSGGFSVQDYSIPDVETGGPVIASDLDADEDLDLLAILGWTNPVAQTLWNDGGGGFSLGPRTALPRGDLCVNVTVLRAVADLTSDGLDDLLVAALAKNGAPSLALFVNLGAGEFARQDLPVELEPLQVGCRPALTVDAADLDGDGDRDILILGESFQTDVRVLLNEGPESWTTSIYPLSSAAKLARDLDGDGLLDVYSRPTAGPVRILWNDGTGRFDSVADLDGDIDTGDPWDFFDADGDGDSDLVVFDEGSLQARLYRQDHDGEGPVFERQVIADFEEYRVPGVSRGVVAFGVLQVVDLDGDRDADLVVNVDVREGIFTTALVNRGDGQFLPTAAADGPYPSGMWEDLDGDGLVDNLSTQGQVFLHRPHRDPSGDCDGDGVYDRCQIEDVPALDCNGNGTLDSCDIATGTAIDSDGDGVIDGCDVVLFRRGDSNGDSEVDLSDAVSTLGVLFLGQGEITCRDAADANDDGAVDLSDAVATLGVLFLGQGVIPLPGMDDCGADPTGDGLGCERYDCL